MNSTGKRLIHTSSYVAFLDSCVCSIQIMGTLLTVLGIIGFVKNKLWMQKLPAFHSREFFTGKNPHSHILKNPVPLPF